MEEEKIPNTGLPKLHKCEPFAINVVPGKIYKWCTCGLTQSQPFCDNIHRRIETITNETGEEVMPYRSLKVEFDEPQEVFFCQCRQTKTPPFCDGTHKTIKQPNGENN
jgi:CDGSH-type Zn-finger protein